jgi:hypothetical protein
MYIPLPNSLFLLIGTAVYLHPWLGSSFSLYSTAMTALLSIKLPNAQPSNSHRFTCCLHAYCSVMHRTSFYHFPLHALQCYPLYKIDHKHVTSGTMPASFGVTWKWVLLLESSLLSLILCVQEAESTYTVIPSLHTTTAAEIKRENISALVTVLLSWNYENSDKFTLQSCPLIHWFSMHGLLWPEKKLDN